MNHVDHGCDINEGERKKILDDIKAGVWRMEFRPGQLPELYGDTKMREILGAEPWLQPEQLYNHWHERIQPEYLSYVDKGIERLLATGQPMEVEYVWNHPQKGKTVMRCDATLSSPRRDGETVLLGLHRDITDKMANNVWQENGYHIVDYYKMNLCGKYLIRAYQDVFLIDIESKVIHPVAYRNTHCFVIKEGRSIAEVIEQCVLPEEQEKVYRLFSDEFLEKIAAEKTSVSVDFRRGAACGRFEWVRGTLYAVQINGDTELLFTIQDIQSEYKLKMLKEEKEDVLHAVVHERSVIYEYEIPLQQLQLLKCDTDNLARSVASATRPLPELVEKMCAHYLDPSEWPKIRAFLSHRSIAACLKAKCKKQISLSLSAAYFQHDYVRISVLPSSKSEEKAYLVLELMDRKERLYPILESYIRDMVDHFYIIDLKTGYFFHLIGSTDAYGMPPKEGYDYRQQMFAYADKFVPEAERELVKKQMSPEYILRVLEKEQELSFVESILGKNGEIQKKLMTYRPLDLAKGSVLLQRVDITDQYTRERMLKNAQRESMTDPLTQLYNRLGSERRIKQALSEKDRNRNAVLIMLDLDNFKEINDRFGHPVGDEILCEAAQKLRKCFRAEDIVGRLGGDEYIVFLRNMPHKSDIHPVLKRLVRELTIVRKKEGESITVTSSVGAAFCGDQSYEELYREADEALYESKKRKNGYAVFGHIK